MSWIHEDDLYRIIERAITDPAIRGIYVATAPNPVRNAEFMRLLRKAVNRPWSPPAPAALVQVGSWLLRTDPELALLGRRCVPTRLLDEGFTFTHRSLEDTFHDLLQSGR
jgi:NAD dependent epimerase/dehydratase family enzyme